ncbi:hypothetical protein PsorP6_010289 [Peronosclerospora sorghi]|uniref:Uncharacterized protein n=1 Tax=Peronosclerospora sorghi TaxID=230839 RepID=A0ACC0VX44_9STRA|nr:hypothetical protein PsorP6_010289 [Peronosclerospora sorghi]
MNGRDSRAIGASDVTGRGMKWGVSSSARLVSGPPRRPPPRPAPAPPPFMHTIPLYQSRKPQPPTTPPTHVPRTPTQRPGPHESSGTPRRRSHASSSLSSSPSSSSHDENACRRASEPPHQQQHGASLPTPRRSNEKASTGKTRHASETPNRLSTLHHPVDTRPRPSRKPQRVVPPSSHEPCRPVDAHYSSPCHRSPTTTSTTTPSADAYIELSPARRREIIANMNHSVQTIMASMVSDQAQTIQWKPKLRKKDISYYTDERMDTPGHTRFCCVTHSHASVHDLVKIFVLADPESMARNCRVLADNLLETRVLAVLRRPTPDRPMQSMYVRYSSYQCCGFLADRELCLVIATDLIQQPDGSTIAYCLWDTVKGPEFDAVSKHEPCVMFRSGFFFRRSARRQRSADPSQRYTKIVYMIGLEQGRGGWSAPNLTTRGWMERCGTNLARLCAHFRRKQLDSRTFVMKTEWRPKMAAKACQICTKHFQVLSKRVNCHACGHVLCKACVSKEVLELPAVGLVPMYICVACLKRAGLPTPSSQKGQRTSRGKRPQGPAHVSSSHTASQAQAPQRRTTKHASDHQHESIEKDVMANDVPNGRKDVAEANDVPHVRKDDVAEANDEDDDEDDTDTGEWAFTLSGAPIRPYRMPK